MSDRLVNRLLYLCIRNSSLYLEFFQNRKKIQKLIYINTTCFVIHDKTYRTQKCNWFVLSKIRKTSVQRNDDEE